MEEIDIDNLTEEYQDLYLEFLALYEDSGCSCFVNPPCSFCTHEGNPLNIEGVDEAWLTAIPKELFEL